MLSYHVLIHENEGIIAVTVCTLITTSYKEAFSPFRGVNMGSV